MSRNLQIFLFLWFIYTFPIILGVFHRLFMAIYMYRNHGTWIARPWATVKPPKLVTFVFHTKHPSEHDIKAKASSEALTRDSIREPQD